MDFRRTHQAISYIQPKLQMGIRFPAVWVEASVPSALRLVLERFFHLGIYRLNYENFRGCEESVCGFLRFQGFVGGLRRFSSESARVLVRPDPRLGYLGGASARVRREAPRARRLGLRGSGGPHQELSSSQLTTARSSSTTSNAASPPKTPTFSNPRRWTQHPRLGLA
jgi:hypothetical protein